MARSIYLCEMDLAMIFVNQVVQKMVKSCGKDIIHARECVSLCHESIYGSYQHRAALQQLGDQQVALSDYAEMAACSLRQISSI